MQKIYLISCALTVAVWGLVLPATAASLYQDMETFHAEYMPQTVHAVHAAGSTNASMLHQPAADFDINPVTGKNEGLRVGTGCASLSYSTSNNLPSTAGSIEIRFKPIDWNQIKGTYNIFFQAAGGTYPPAKLYIYRASVSGVGVNFSFGGSPPNILLFQNSSNWQNHVYHHLVFTYDASGDAVLFIDGVEVARAVLGTPASPALISWPENFTVGPTGSVFGQDGQTAVERVRIYNTALTVEQVQYLASKTEFNQVIGSFSDWFTGGRPKLGLAALDKETVPPPWTPVSYSNQSAFCWNRQYDFSGTSLLQNVSAGAEALLSGPVALNLTVSGQSGTLSLGAPAIVSQGAGRIVMERSGSFGSTAAAMQYTFEYDGLLWCDLSLTIPSGSALEALSLQTHFEKEIAQLTHYTGAPGIYTSQNVPKNSYGKAIPETPGVHHLSGLKTMVWIGNNKKGLLWCTESDQYWWPKDRTNSFSIVRQSDGDVAFTVDMVTSALPANAPQTLNYRFGLMATPIKTLPDGWRAWTHSDQALGRTGDKRGINVFYWPSEYRFMMLDQDPTRYVNVQATRDRIASDRNLPERRFIIPYWTRTNIYDTYDEARSSTDSTIVKKVQPEASLITREWGTLPTASATYRLSATSEWADYLVWNLESFTEVMGHSDGWYMDEVQPIPNNRSESGGGYDSLDGTRRPTFEMFGTRNMMKRMAYNTWQRNGERPRAVAHCSATQNANSLGAFDMWLIGEQYNSGYFWANPELKPPPGDPVEEVYFYSYALPMDRVRAECYPQQWGQVMVWLPQLKDQPNIMQNAASTRDMLSRVLQADMVIWPLWCNSAEVHKTWQFRKAFDVGAAGVQFHPYWEQNTISALFEKPGQSLWLKFNESSGTVAGDSSLFNRHGTLTDMNPETAWSETDSIRFSNDGGYVQCAADPVFQTNTYTVELWLKAVNSGITGRHLVETHSGNAGFYTQLHSDDRLCSYQAVDGSMYKAATYVPFPHDGAFHHVAVSFSYDGATCTLKTYIDGVLKATKSTAGTPNLALENTPLKIGHGTFDGNVRDVRFHTRVLSDAEILQLAQGVASNEDDTVIGYYSKPSGEHLVLVSNLSRQPRTVKIDFPRLSVTGVSDAETGSSLPLNEDGSLTLNMLRNDYRALRVDASTKSSSFFFSIKGK